MRESEPCLTTNKRGMGRDSVMIVRRDDKISQRFKRSDQPPGLRTKYLRTLIYKQNALPLSDTSTLYIHALLSIIAVEIKIS